MTSILPYLTLAVCLALPAFAVAQQPTEPAINAVAPAETDLGTLQAELARVEAERQRLAQRLASSANTSELEQLRETNRALQSRQIENDLQAQVLLEKQLQQRFMMGAGTVLVSLLVGFMLNRGGRRKRREWLN